jgi:putative aldouronate transport system permease protein
MYFLLIAFKDYNLVKGVMASPWVGLKYFEQLFKDSSFLLVMRNTLGINLLNLLICFPAPIVFALLVNELRGKVFRKFVQTGTFIPYFLSWAVFGGLVINFLSPSTGFVNDILVRIGLLKEPVFFMADPKNFWGIVVSSGLIKGLGYSSIIYLAAIAGVDQEMFEAARVDGATRFQCIWHITLPSISNTIVILLIFAIASIMNTGMEQILVLQNVMNLSMSETLDTYVYKVGLIQMSFSYATAVGLFKSIVAVILLYGANTVSKRVAQRGLF